jgi:hypothetical protein
MNTDETATLSDIETKWELHKNSAVSNLRNPTVRACRRFAVKVNNCHSAALGVIFAGQF